MIDLDVRIDPIFASCGVEVCLGLLRARVTQQQSTDLTEALDAATARARERAADGAGSVPEIAATRRAYKACGKDPSRYRPASEALLRRVLKGDAPPRINPVVDVNNLLSLTTAHAAGVYATARLTPPLLLRVGAADDIYEGIGRGALNIEGLPVLADTLGPFGSPTSDSTRAAVDATVEDVLLVVYGFDHAVQPSLELAETLFVRHLAACDLWRTVVTGDTSSA